MSDSPPGEQQNELISLSPSSDIDVAAAMGFDSFGAKPHLAKKRKTQDKDSKDSGSNSLPLESRLDRSEKETQHTLNSQQVSEELQSLDGQQDLGYPKFPGTKVLGRGEIVDERVGRPYVHHMESAYQGTYSQQGKLPNGHWDWQALRRGIRNERGDTAFYDASFVEDPWAVLKKKG